MMKPCVLLIHFFSFEAILNLGYLVAVEFTSITV